MWCDIIAVYTEDGRKICTYTYDAWGNCTTTTVSGNVGIENAIAQTYNPFRYRGYYYDTETGVYYLQSRYYNPRWGRFINADGLIGTGGLIGYNMFTYCNNNPVMLCDCTGTCAHTNTEDFHCRECNILINSGEPYPKATPKNNNPVQVQAPDYESEKIKEKNEYIGVNGDEAYWILNGFFDVCEIVAPGAIPPVFSYGAIAAIDIIYIWDNTNLITSQKIYLSIIEIELGVIGVLGTAILATTPAAVAILPISIAYSVVTNIGVNALITLAEEENRRFGKIQ